MKNSNTAVITASEPFRCGVDQAFSSGAEAAGGCHQRMSPPPQTTRTTPRQRTMSGCNGAGRFCSVRRRRRRRHASQSGPPPRLRREGRWRQYYGDRSGRNLGPHLRLPPTASSAASSWNLPLRYPPLRKPRGKQPAAHSCDLTRVLRTFRRGGTLAAEGSATVAAAAADAAEAAEAAATARPQAHWPCRASSATPLPWCFSGSAP